MIPLRLACGSAYRVIPPTSGSGSNIARPGAKTPSIRFTDHLDVEQIPSVGSLAPVFHQAFGRWLLLILIDGICRGEGSIAGWRSGAGLRLVLGSSGRWDRWLRWAPE
jgi:hypothetical protein